MVENMAKTIILNGRSHLFLITFFGVITLFTKFRGVLTCVQMGIYLDSFWPMINNVEIQFQFKFLSSGQEQLIPRSVCLSVGRSVGPPKISKKLKNKDLQNLLQNFTNITKFYKTLQNIGKHQSEESFPPPPFIYEDHQGNFGKLENILTTDNPLSNRGAVAICCRVLLSAVLKYQ